MRIYDTCNPNHNPMEFRVAEKGNSTDGITKLAWSPDLEPSIVFVGRRCGTVDKWDIRVKATGDSTDKPVSSLTIPNTSETIMDLEISKAHGLMMLAAGNKVYSI